jgi:hypothetical protein
MKKIFLFIAIAVAAVAMGSCSCQKSNTRDLAYEAYCDSIYETNPDYYLDVLCETDEYCTYILFYLWVLSELVIASLMLFYGIV